MRIKAKYLRVGDRYYAELWHCWVTVAAVKHTGTMVDVTVTEVNMIHSISEDKAVLFDGNTDLSIMVMREDSFN